MWSSFKSNIKQMLQERMPVILQMNQAPGLPIYEQRLRELEAVANNAISSITPNMLLAFANRVERYYPMALRQEDLKEIP
jgi:hypothetical protein